MWFVIITDDRMVPEEMQAVALATGTRFEEASKKLVGEYHLLIQAYGTLAMMGISTSRLQVSYEITP